MENNREVDLNEPGSVDFKLYKYRWVVLFIFCFYSCMNFAQYLQFSIITNIVKRYYDLETFDVSWTSLVFMIGYIVLFIPVSYLMEKYDLRKISLGISFLTTVGTLIKLFSIHQDKYYVVLIGQTFCAIGQVFMMSIPSKLAAVWFGKDEVSTATAFAVVGTQLGVAIGCFVPPKVVANHDDLEEVGDELYQLVLYNLIVTLVSFALTIMFFRAKPYTPPNQIQFMASTNPIKLDYFKSLKNIFTNRDFLFLIIAIGLSNGIWNTFGIEFNTIYLNYFPEGEEDAGLIALVAILVGGVGGSIIFGVILDKTHRFKLTTFTIIFLGSLFFLGAAFLLEEQQETSVFVIIVLFGFFISGSLAVGFEYAMELTYPEPESITLASLNAIILAFGLIFVVIVDGLIGAIGFLWTNITIAIVLTLCSFSTLFISNNLRRLNVNNGISN
ncbi:choline/ethanolamine transporter flvcr2a-like [Onthophagus taurus]|uniref:choline/ethanolamine transporter flvcr2a-like n=1 Tax=Onthophagus taurus TaxID=166361 RepID=UPI0039BDB2DF